MELNAAARDTAQRLNIAFLTKEPAHDKRRYSGSLYYMGQALERHCGSVTYLERVISWEKRYLGRVLREASLRVLHRQLIPDRLLFIARKQARIAARRLAGQSFDIIIAPDCVSEIAFLQTAIPVFLPLDVTFRLQHDYYPEYSHLLALNARQAEIVEAAAFQSAAQLLFSSPWAARSAVKDYGVDARKVHAIFFGANIDTIPTPEQILAKKLSDRCKLLFIGLGWERKGGDIAFETLLKLEEMGIEAELTVCGSTPPPGITYDRMKVIPYLDKNDERQARQIEQLYAQADFLLLPTRADCAPNVYKEASAFGVPSITTATGGVADVVLDGENGYTLPYEAHGEAYASLIAELYRDEARWRRLALSSRAAYDERLSWDAWAQSVHEIAWSVVRQHTEAGERAVFA